MGVSERLKQQAVTLELERSRVRAIGRRGLIQTGGSPMMSFSGVVKRVARRL